MDTEKIHQRLVEWIKGETFPQILVVFVLSLAVSLIISNTIWARYFSVLHTVFEMICIFIGLSSFLIIWLNTEVWKHSRTILGFGFLAVVVLDVFHVLYFPGLQLYPEGFYDLSTRFWVAGRFLEAVVLILSTYGRIKLPVNRWLLLLMVLCGAIGFSMMIIHIPSLMPVLYTPIGVTTEKKIMEYIIVGMFVFCLFRLSRVKDQSRVLSYRHIYRAVLIIIPAELCFTVFTTLSSFYLALGHVLKVVYYFYLFYGIYISFVRYPYETLRTTKIRLKEARNELKDILNGLPLALVNYDNTLQVSFVNQRAAELLECESKSLLGLTAEEMGRKFGFLNFCANNTPYKDAAENATSGKTIEASLVTSNGTKKDLLFQSNEIRNTKGQVVGYIGISSDITRYKKEQKKILHQEKLAIIGQMGAGIVHETKNHLASIKGYCQLLALKADDQSKRHIERIENISEDLNRVIVDFLTIAKPGETKLDITSLNKIIESVRYMIESPSFMKSVKIQMDLGEFEGDILADESQIKQVILNMAKNSIEAMSHKEEARLHICTRQSEKGDEALLIIRDNGKGISREEMELLGTPFFTTKDNGTGLGLSICYRIIKEHGGSIEVESEEGKGTTFTIRIPLIPGK